MIPVPSYSSNSSHSTPKSNYVLPKSLSIYLTRQNYTKLLWWNALLSGLMAVFLLTVPHRSLPAFLLLHTSTKNTQGEDTPTDLYSPQLHEVARLYSCCLLTLSFILYQTSKSYDGPFRGSIAKAMVLNHSLQSLIALRGVIFGLEKGYWNLAFIGGEVFMALLFLAFFKGGNLKVFELPTVGGGRF